MKVRDIFCAVVVLAAAVWVYSDSGGSTRVANETYHACTEKGGYPYRSKAEYVLKELDIKEGDAVADIGAGDGWWTERIAERVGATGTVHALEVEQKKVDQMKERFKEMSQVKAGLCPLDGTGLEEDAVDLVFLSKTYHHLEDGKVAYWEHLAKVVKATGRVCVIEKHPGVSKGRDAEHAWPPGKLMGEADEGGWIAVRYEMIRGTHHYMAVFVQKELFTADGQ